MELRSAPLPHDQQYFLDGAIEAWEIGAFCHNCISLFGETAVVDRITEGGNRAGHWRRDRKARCADLDAYAHAIAAELGERWQRTLMAAAIPYEIKIANDVAEICADWNHEDETTGGALDHWRKVVRCDRSFEPTKALRRHLYAPSAIRSYVKIRCQDEFAHAKEMIGRLRRLPWPESLDEGHLLIEAREESLRRHRRLVETTVQAMGAGLKTPRAPKSLPKPERKKLTRAASIASAVLGDDKVRRFVSGEAVEIEGETMILEARPLGLLRSGHGQLEVAVKNKARQELGKLCVYFDGTPALDQLAAFALHVGAGNEGAILTTGNLYSVTIEGAKDPLLAHHMRKRESLVIPVPGFRGRLLGDFQLQRIAKLRYFADVGHHYVEAVTTQMWGRDGKRLRAFAETTSGAGQ